MTGIPHRQLLLSVLLYSLPVNSFSAVTTCRADGVTDVTSCLKTQMAAAWQQGDSQFFLQRGTYLISQPLVVPTKMQFAGVGRGDAGLIGTTVKASPSFPTSRGIGVVNMGPDGQPSFGVRVKDMTIDGAGRAAIALRNTSSMEQSYGEDLLLKNFTQTGLDVETTGSQNSGSFRNLEIYAGPNSTVQTNCIVVKGSISFRGISGVTCNADTAPVQPSVALQLDGAGTYSDIHIEHYTTGVHLGSPVAAADGMVMMSLEFGPSVQTGIVIDDAYPSQNLAFMGIKCVGCSTQLEDRVTGRTLLYDVGLYTIGNGAASSKKVITTDAVTPSNLW